MIAPCVPRPASSPPPAWWRAFVCRPSGRTASTKHTSATAALRSPVSYARRPRSRLGIPVRLRGPGEGVGSSWLRPASPTPGERGRRSSCQPIGSQPLLAIARDSLCLPLLVPYRLRRGYCRPTLLPCPSASTACRRPSLCSDADLLCPLSALTLATGQVFNADHASVSIVPRSLP